MKIVSPENLEEDKFLVESDGKSFKVNIFKNILSIEDIGEYDLLVKWKDERSSEWTS